MESTQIQIGTDNSGGSCTTGCCPPQGTAGQSAAAPQRRNEPKVGRNDPCPCDSGRKFKKCCGR